MSNSVSQYADVFFAETQEHLQNLNDALLRLEKNPSDKEAINTVFRSAHTIKGMAATMGFRTITTLTHHLEDVLDKVRTGATSLSPQLSDLLFNGVDTLEEITALAQSGREPGPEVLSDWLQDISRYSDAAPSVPCVTADPAMAGQVQETVLGYHELGVLAAAQARGFHPYFIEIELKQDCLMKAVRAFLVFQRLEPEGEILRSEPTVEDLEEEKFDDSFRLLFISQLGEPAIHDLVAGISDVIDVRITPVSETAEIPDDMIPDGKTRLSGKAPQLLATQTVRIDIHRLDNLMNLVGELVITKTRLDQLLLTSGSPEIEETLKSLSRVAGGLQDAIMKTRMVPLSQVFNRFPRMVRDLARDLRRKIDFIIEGEETELDRSVIDEIGDPLVHLLRNAVDHGIESETDRQARGKSAAGTVRLSARYEGNRVLIVVEDDGAGVDQDRVLQHALKKDLISPEQAGRMTGDEINRLLFLPGFSSTEKVSDVSGRGVGLDVVQNKIESLGGMVEVGSELGQGTRFSIRLPLTLAIIQALMIRVSDEVYALPLETVEEIQVLEATSINRIRGQEVMTIRGEVVPLIRLDKVLNTGAGGNSSSELPVVIVKGDGSRAGLVVDNLVGQREIVIKSLGRLFGGLPGIAGATVLGDGRVALILDPDGVLGLSERLQGAGSERGQLL